MRLGFIGYGNMGRIIVRSLLADGSVAPRQITVYNRTADKMGDLVREHPGVTIADTTSEVATVSDVVFICVRTGAVGAVLDSLAPELREGTHLVAINGGIQLKNLARGYGGPITKIIPSVTMEAGRGVTLVCHNDRVTAEMRRALETLFARSSIVKVIAEDQFEVAGDLTSCGPALMAEMMNKFAEAGARHGTLSYEESLKMVLETMVGTAALLADRKVPVEELEARVATKGGITEQGLKVLDSELPSVFDRMMAATLEKHEKVKREISASYESS